MSYDGKIRWGGQELPAFCDLLTKWDETLICSLCLLDSLLGGLCEFGESRCGGGDDLV